MEDAGPTVGSPTSPLARDPGLGLFQPVVLVDLHLARPGATALVLNMLRLKIRSSAKRKKPGVKGRRWKMALIVVVAQVLGFLSSIHAVMSTRTSQEAIAWVVAKILTSR